MIAARPTPLLEMIGPPLLQTTRVRLQTADGRGAERRAVTGAARAALDHGPHASFVFAAGWPRHHLQPRRRDTVRRLRRSDGCGLAAADAPPFDEARGRALELRSPMRQYAYGEHVRPSSTAIALPAAAGRAPCA